MAKIFNFPPKMAKYLKNIFLNKKIFPLPLVMIKAEKTTTDEVDNDGPPNFSKVSI